MKLSAAAGGLMASLIASQSSAEAKIRLAVGQNPDSLGARLISIKQSAR